MKSIGMVVALVLVVAACSGGDAVETSTSNTTVETTTTTTAQTTTSAAVSASTTTTVESSDPRRPVILDYSPTISDVGALAFLATHPDLRLIGVTLPGTGESYCDEGVAHTRGILVALGLADVPVACGPDEPMTGWNAFPTSWRVASNELDLPVAAPNDERSAPELLADLLEGSDAPVEMVAVGPLTNLGHLFTDRADLAREVAGVTIMGGAVDVPGNVFRNEVGEWNIWVDPTAAGIVFDAVAEVTLVPLDATNDLPTSQIFHEALRSEADTPAAEIVRDVWAADPAWAENAEGWMFFWDELAAAVIVEPSLVEFETRRLVVDDDTRENKGWTREDPAGAEVRVAVSADRRGFETLFLSTLVGRVAAPGYMTPTAEEVAYFEKLEAAGLRFDAALGELFAEAGEPESEEEFVAVLVMVLPRLLGEVVPALAGEVATTTPPVSLASLHESYAGALSDFASMSEELIPAVEAAGGFEPLEPFVEPIAEACASLQQEVAVRLLDVRLACFD